MIHRVTLNNGRVLLIEEHDAAAIDDAMEASGQ